jgi:hypothetical protein
MKKEKDMKILSILLVAAIAFSPIHAAKKSVKLAKGSYHQICKDLNDNILKPGKKLSRAEKKAVGDYLGAKKISRLKKRDIKHFENAIKKHRFIKVNKKSFSKKLGNNLKKWPKKSSVGKWYQLLKSPKGGNSKQVNSSSGNPDGTNELMDQDHEQTN